LQNVAIKDLGERMQKKNRHLVEEDELK